MLPQVRHLHGNLFFRFILLASAGTLSARDPSLIIPLPHSLERQYMDIASLADGSFALTTAEIMEDPVLLHISAQGELLHEVDGLSVPGRALESGGWIVPTHDGGCYVVAYSEPRATGIDSDIAVFRFSGDLELLWTEHIGGGNDLVHHGFGAAPGAGNGVLVMGGTGYGGEESFLRCYSPEGVMSWEYVPSPGIRGVPVALEAVSGGCLLLLTHMWQAESMLQKLDREGELEWTATLPVRSGFGPAALAETEDGYLAYFSSEDDVRSGVLVETTLDGTLFDTVSIHHGLLVRDALLEPDGRLLLAGRRSIDGEVGAAFEAWDRTGTRLWTRRIDGPDDDGFSALCRAEDGYALLGFTRGEVDGALFIVTDTGGAFPEGTPPTDYLEAGTLCPGWVVACGVFTSESSAYDEASRLHDLTGLGWPEAIWIPDWPSLSGYEGWLACLANVRAGELTETAGAALKEACPDAYSVWVGVDRPEETIDILNISP